jgi:RNA polymerase sigma-70 factor (ECF subfamily)
MARGSAPGAPADDAAREALARALADDGDRLYGLALRVTRDPEMAADAVQDAFTSALQRLSGFRGESRIGTWLYRIVYNKSVDLLRQRGREEALPEDEDGVFGSEDERLARAPAWARPPDEIFQDAETSAVLAAAVEKLTPLQRAVFELKEVDGLPTEEVGEILDLKPGAVRVHLHRARLRLRSLLGGRFRGNAP